MNRILPILLLAGCGSSVDETLSDRYLAVVDLGETDDPAALPALNQALLDRDKSVREAAEYGIRRIGYTVQARGGRYVPPAEIPAIGRSDPARYLEVHRRFWDYEVSRPTLSAFAAPELGSVHSSICELPPLDTEAGYAGQHDGTEFLQALHRRSKRDPAATDDFRRLRAGILAAHPDWHRP